MLVYLTSDKGDTPPLKGIETKHSETPSETPSVSLVNKVIELRKMGYSLRKIAKELNLSLSKVWRILNEQKVFQNIHSKSGGYPTNENEGSNGGQE